MRKKLKNLGNRVSSGVIKAHAWIIGICILLSMPKFALAADVGSSLLATGTKKLVADLTTWLMILAPTVTVLMVVYYLIRKSASDEMDASATRS